MAKAGLVVLGQMLLCVLGIYGSFFSWSILQEKIATHRYVVDGKEQRFKYVFFLNSVQAICASLVGLITMVVMSFFEPKDGEANRKRGSFPLRLVLQIGFTATFASPFGYAAMQRISYPMVLTVKMCKMVPILMVGAVWHRRKYSTLKYVDCLLITLGVVMFTVFSDDGDDNKKSAANSLLGIALVLVNLVLDGFTNSTQDEVVKRNGYGGSRMMMVTNVAILFWSIVTLVAGEYILPPNPIVRPELSAAANFIAQQPGALQDVVLMGSLGAVGQFFIFQTIALFGSLTVTAMTVTRKVGSVLISIFYNDHSVTGEQWFALLMISFGVILDAYINIQEKKQKDHAGYQKKHDDEHERERKDAPPHQNPAHTRGGPKKHQH